MLLSGNIKQTKTLWCGIKMFFTKLALNPVGNRTNSSFLILRGVRAFGERRGAGECPLVSSVGISVCPLSALCPSICFDGLRSAIAWTILRVLGPVRAVAVFGGGLLLTPFTILEGEAGSVFTVILFKNSFWYELSSFFGTDFSDLKQ